MAEAGDEAVDIGGRVVEVETGAGRCLDAEAGVEGLGTAGEDDLDWVGSVEESRDLQAGVLEGFGGTFGEGIDATMDVGVVALVVGCVGCGRRR
jgi:hypothetical protein